MSRYDKLFREYVEELKEARDEALAWWDSLLALEAGPSGDRKKAESAVRPRWPCGPVSHPRVIGVYRKYFLLCEELNNEIRDRWESQEDMTQPGGGSDETWGVDDKEEEGVVEPRFILMEKVTKEDAELGRFINTLLFSPIGTNEKGETV